MRTGAIPGPVRVRAGGITSSALRGKEAPSSAPSAIRAIDGTFHLSRAEFLNDCLGMALIKLTCAAEIEAQKICRGRVIGQRQYPGQSDSKCRPAKTGHRHHDPVSRDRKFRILG
jgi:hypothetical protein